MDRRKINFAEDDPADNYQLSIDEKLLSISELSSLNSDEDSDSPPPPTIPMRKHSGSTEYDRHTNYDSNRHQPIKNVSDNIKDQIPSDDDDAENPGPLLGVQNASAGRLRRNSISLPSGLNTIDLEALQQAYLNEKVDISPTQSTSTESTGNIDSTANCSISKITEIVHIADSSSDLEESEHEKPQYKTPLRTKRRLSVAPLPSLRLNDKEMLSNSEYDVQSVMSNQNSITSINSLASLLKEKIQMFPSMIRRKKKVTSDIKIKAFVTLLFLIIVFLVGYAYIMYHQTVLARLYFDKIKFSKTHRTIRVYDAMGVEILSGNLGRNIKSQKPFHCLDDKAPTDGTLCLEWDGKARLYLSYDNKESVDCYGIKWQALNQHLFPEDCFDLPAEDKGNWYGGGITKDNDWPLDGASFSFAPFITGDARSQQFGNALKRYFISSEGAAILIDDQTPLHISINNGSRQFCMKAMNDQFAYVNRFTAAPELNYKVCINSDMKVLHQHLTQQSLWDGLKEADISVVHSILEEPVWQIPAATFSELSESSIYNYTEDVIALGFLRLGHVLVNEFWQKEIGDYVLDTDRFPTLENTVNILHRRGFKVVFTIQPFISTDSVNFAEAIQKKLLIYERLSEKSIPALTRYKSSVSSGVLDVTNSESLPWLLEKLKKIVKDYQIDSFFIDFGNGYNLPHYYQCNRSLVNPDQYKSIFMQNLDGGIGVFAVSGAVNVPKPPAFLSLPPVNSSWEGLQSILTTVLSYGIIGYPFILPGPIGGDYLLPHDDSKLLSYHSLEQPPLPEQELFVRWLQLATFLPSIRFSHLPSEYKNDFVTEIAKELTMIRQKTVIPILKKYLSDAMNEGLPLVRPLWMLDTQDAACLSVHDEFSIGEELIVAPILLKGQTKREVYLPQGVWKDGVDGSLRKGSRWIHNYRVPVEKVAYFVKMPDNTRF